MRFGDHFEFEDRFSPVEVEFAMARERGREVVYAGERQMGEECQSPDSEC